MYFNFQSERYVPCLECLLSLLGMFIVILWVSLSNSNYKASQEDNGKQMESVISLYGVVNSFNSL